MRQLAILTFQTLDGVMQAPVQPDEDTSGGFAHGSWCLPHYDQVMAQVMAHAMAAPYDLLLGRKTYESFAAHWQRTPTDSPVARKLNNATKYVVTSSTRELEWPNSVRITGDVAAEISRLKQRDGPLLQVHGSWQLIQTLLSHDLIDEFRLWTFPVMVGSGKRLFGDGTIPKELTLEKTKATENGVVMGIYRRARST